MECLQGDGTAKVHQDTQKDRSSDTLFYSVNKILYFKHYNVRMLHMSTFQSFFVSVTKSNYIYFSFVNMSVNKASVLTTMRSI